MMNLPLPTWCTDEIFKCNEDLFKTYLDALFLTPTLKRMVSGGLSKRVLENMNSNRKYVAPRKIFMFSCHDVTLAVFARAHNISIFKLPPFGSAIIVEKYKDSQMAEYVRVRLIKILINQFFILE